MKSLVLVVLAGSFVLSRPALSQAQSAPPAGSLKIFVLQGEGAVNDTSSRRATVPVVEVRDDRDRVVEGATVTFEVSPVGPGGLFANQQPSITARTDMQGQAAGAGFTPNSETGRFRIKVTATSQGRTATIYIPQTNSAKEFAAETIQRKGISKKWWIIGAVAGGGALAAALVLTRGGSGSNSHSVTATPGPITVGPPK